MRRLRRREAVRLLLGSCAVGVAAGCNDSGSGGAPPTDGSQVPRSNPLALSRELKRGPYVQLGSTDSIDIIWQTLPGVEGVLEYGPTPELGNRVSSGATGTTHALSLGGLDATSEYYYRILAGDVPLTSTLRLHTNHADDSGPFKFLVFGDSGTGSREQMRLAGLINRSDAAFGLHTGDIVYVFGEEENYDPYFFYPYASFLARSVLYPTFGNHDSLTNQGEPYFRNFHLPRNDRLGTEAFYSFDYGNAHIICLNSMDYDGPDSHQRRWLISDLQRTSKPWKFVFFHMPPYTAGFLNDGGQKIPLDTESVRRNLIPVFEEFGIDIVFSGHSHSYERTYPLLNGEVAERIPGPLYSNPPGPIYVVTGGGGARLLGLDKSPLNASQALAHHFVEVEINGNELTGRAIGLDGMPIDEFQIRKG